MADGADLRIHPTGAAVLSVSCQSQGQGHEPTFAQLVAAELGLSPDDVEVVHGDTDRTPFGLGTYGSRSTAVSGAAAVVAARKARERARRSRSTGTATAWAVRSWTTCCRPRSNARPGSSA